MDGFTALSDFADDGDTGRLEELVKLREVWLFLRCSDAEGALLRSPLALPCGGVWGRASTVAIALLHERRSVERAAGRRRECADGVTGPTFSARAR